MMTRKNFAAIAIASFGLAAAGAYANDMHKQEQSGQSSNSGSTQSSMQKDSKGTQGSMQSSTGQQGAQESSTVKQVQTALQQKGYDVGAIDGVMGSQTEQALKQAQKDHDLEQTGQINPRTLAALGVSESGQTGK